MNFKRGDLVQVVQIYSHPIDTVYPTRPSHQKSVQLQTGLVGEILAVNHTAMDSTYYFVDVWFPSLKQYTCGTYYDHFKPFANK